MDILSMLIIGIVALCIGFFAGKWLAPDQRKLKVIQEQMAQQEAEHQAYREKVAGHFSDTAKQFNNLTTQYRGLYQHLSDGAQDLCERRSIPRELATAHVNILSVESPELEPKVKIDSSTGPVEPTVVDVSNPGLSPISQANQAIYDEHKLVPDSAEVIQLDEQRPAAGESIEPAKDYAIKEKGVINHNSLNRDDVNT